LLLKPVVRVAFVVEGLDLEISGAPLKGDRFGEGLVGVEPEDSRPCSPRAALKRGHETASEALPSRLWGRPDSLDLGDAVIVKFQGAACDRFPAAVREKQETCWRPELAWTG